MLIFIFSGGTGGHINPALATSLLLSESGHNIQWFGQKTGMESSVCNDRMIDFYGLSLQGFNGKTMIKKMLALVLFAFASIQVLIQCLRQKPNVLVCFGGYTTIPALLSAYVLRLPLVVHEQNTLISSANQLASEISKNLYIGMPTKDQRWKLIGNPLCSSFHSADKRKAQRPVVRKNIAVIGGSQGATAINTAVSDCLKYSSEPWQWQIFTGAGKLKDIDESLYALPHLDIDEYCLDMPGLYQWADIIICRAGAMTISEVTIYGLPSILIPLPQSINNHQFENAKQLVSIGGCKLMEQAMLSGMTLHHNIKQLLSDCDDYQTMSQAAITFAQPNAAIHLAKVIVDCGNNNNMSVNQAS